MSGDAVRIDELILRIGGLSPDDAHALAGEVARRLAGRLHGTGRTAQIDEVRVEIPSGLTGAALAEAIADQIARSAR